MKKMLAMFVISAMVAAPALAFPRKGAYSNQEQPSSIKVGAAGSMEVAFSPDEGGEDLVVKVIDAAQRDIRMLAYSFTSPRVVRALLDARHRGVAVALVADYEENIPKDRSGKAQAALSGLAAAGADVRTISAFQIHHDKVIVVDAETVQTGSYNYSSSAAHKNSENVVVAWRNNELARAYLRHFDRNYRLSTPYTGR